MHFQKNTVCLISLILVFSVLKYCTSYRHDLIDHEQPLNLYGKTIVIHWGEDVRYVSDITLTNSEMQVNSSFLGSGEEAAQVVHFYIDTLAVSGDPNSGRFIIPFHAIQKIEIVDIDVAKTVFATVGCITAVIGVIFLLILLLKESCPFIYAYDGNSFVFEGEIYSGAIHPPLERHDYLPLPHLKATDDEYHIRMSNEVREIQYTNLAELLIFDHSPKVSVLMDKYGRLCTLAQPQVPVAAYNLNQQDIRQQISHKDSLYYLVDPLLNDSILMDGIVLTFARPRDVQTAKLIVRIKNSFWLDYIYGQFYNLFGEEYHDWFEEQKNNSKEKMMQWALDQGIPLSVYIENEGEWQFVDYFNTVGPMAFKDDVLILDISDISSETIKVKIEFGFLFWEIDYTAIDFSENQPVTRYMPPLRNAIDQNNRDISSLLTENDEQYFVLSEIGDQALLTYPAPKMEDNSTRTIYLHSKGHYEVLRNPQGRPDIGYLLSFKKSGRFIEFSKQRFRYLEKSLKK